MGRRTIRATLPDGALEELRGLPGVAGAERHGDAVILSCTDSDAAIRALLEAHPGARDIEIASAALEDAFLELTVGPSAGGARMSAQAYTRFELVRTMRNRRLMMFALGFPLLVYLAAAAPNRDVDDFGGTGISLPLYYMVGLVSFGTMMALITTGARIASERTDGWTRQLRVTPLAPRAYFRAKLLTGYAMAGLTIALLYAAGVVARRAPARRRTGWR